VHIGVEPLTLGLLSHAAARSDSPAGFEYGCTHQAAETHYLMRQAVELEVADAIDRFLAAAAPPRQHLRARQQLRKRIGLGQIIVAARPQSLDPIIDLAERRENERGRLDAFAAQGANDREPVEFGEPAVDDEHVILAVAVEVAIGPIYAGREQGAHNAALIAAACLDTDRGEGGACARSGRGRAPEDDSGPLRPQLAPFAAHLSGLDRADACSGFIHEADIARRLSYFAF
jgi:hypothetical protein